MDAQEFLGRKNRHQSLIGAIDNIYKNVCKIFLTNGCNKLRNSQFIGCKTKQNFCFLLRVTLLFCILENQLEKLEENT